MDTLTGALEHIVYHNEQNGYTVADFDIDGAMVTCIGTLDSPREGLYLKMNGEWVNHPVYGEQFKYSSCTIATPTTESGLVRYLSSGLLPGIGERKAKDIVNYFGLEVLDILDRMPERLTEVPGIGRKTVEGIIEAYGDHREEREVILALQEYGISVTYGMKLYNVYGPDTVSILLNNPYRIIRDVSGIGFRIADHIASLLEISENHPQRLQAGVIQSLRECYSSGNTYMRRDELISETAALLNVTSERLQTTVSDMIISGDIRMEIVGGHEAYFPPMLFETEDSLALDLVRIANTKTRPVVSDVEDAIDNFEELAGMILDHSQRTAVAIALESPAVVITGGPGTGKTTIVSALIALYTGAGKTVALCAPTGRAAKRMAEATGRPAKTIHRLLEYEPTGDDAILRFGRDEDNPLNDDVVIVDEASMVDTQLMASLTRALTPGMRMILVGDVDQLPSVGPGQVLRDIIEAAIIPVVRLEAVYRQAKGSAIARAAWAINAGETPEIPPKGDIAYISRTMSDEALSVILELAKRFPDIQIIAPMRKGAMGTIALNAELQKAMNPASPDKKERTFGTVVFREGDRIMQTKNDYRIAWEDAVTRETGEGVFNGDIGIIKRIDNVSKTLTVHMMDDKIVTYSFEQLSSLIHAYAMTIHKSQGSEFARVVLPLVGGPPNFLTRKLLYTAVTRAKSKLFLVGPWRCLIAMINSDGDGSRQTGLKERIALYRDMFPQK